MANGEHWRVAVGGKQRGPFTTDQLRGMIHQGQVDPTSLVWTDGMPNWLPWSQVDAFRDLGGQPAPADAAPAGQWNTVDVLTFRQFVPPFLIHLVFWVALVANLLTGAIVIFQGLNFGNQGTIITGAVIIIVGSLTVRLICEIWLMLSRVNEQLDRIRGELEQRQ